jgi:hypothetical protein
MNRRIRLSTSVTAPFAAAIWATGCYPGYPGSTPSGGSDGAPDSPTDSAPDAVPGPDASGDATVNGDGCADGACGTACGTSSPNSCDGSCVNEQSDLHNCGGCGVACTGGMTCQAAQCACPQGLVSCSGTCVNEQTDSHNCAACGHDCRYGACDGTGQCNSWIIAHTSGQPGIASDGTNIVWIDGSSVLEAPVAGGSPITLATVPSGWTAPGNIAISSGIVAWTAWQPPGASSVYDEVFRAFEGTADSGAGVASGPTQGGPFGGPVGFAMNATGSTGYFVDYSSGRIESCSLGTNVGSCSALPPAVGLATGSDTIALSGGTLFWTESSSGGVYEMPIGGTTPVAVATGESGPFGLVLDSTWVYWATSAASINRNLQTNLDASAPSNVLKASTGNLSAIATDGKYVYYAGNFGAATVGYVPAAGGNGQTLYTHAGSGNVTVVVAVSGSVYFYDSSDMTIRGIVTPP